jgi:hypothetical protein
MATERVSDEGLMRVWDAVEANGPEPGSLWRHARTARVYVVVSCALAEEGFEPLIVYRPAGGGPVFCRALSSWRTAVRLPGGGASPRFVRTRGDAPAPQETPQ